MAKRKSTKGQEELEDTKGVIRTHVSKKNRQHNGQKKKKQKDKQRSLFIGMCVPSQERELSCISVLEVIASFS
jgi:hypothetical protein